MQKMILILNTTTRRFIDSSLNLTHYSACLLVLECYFSS